jgi:aspartokinase
VRVLNSRRPDAPGTLITARPSAGRSTACALACRRPITLVEVESRGALRPHEFLAHVCGILDECRVPVAIMTAAHSRITIALDDERQLEALVDRLRPVADVSRESGMALLSLVSKRLAGDAAVFGEALAALEGLTVRMVSQLPSGRSVAIVVREEDVRAAMTRLHDRFFPAAVAPALLRCAQA